MMTALVDGSNQFFVRDRDKDDPPGEAMKGDGFKFDFGGEDEDDEERIDHVGALVGPHTPVRKKGKERGMNILSQSEISDITWVDFNEKEEKNKKAKKEREQSHVLSEVALDEKEKEKRHRQGILDITFDEKEEKKQIQRMGHPTPFPSIKSQQRAEARRRRLANAKHEAPEVDQERTESARIFEESNSNENDEKKEEKEKKHSQGMLEIKFDEKEEKKQSQRISDITSDDWTVQQKKYNLDSFLDCKETPLSDDSISIDEFIAMKMRVAELETQLQLVAKQRAQEENVDEQQKLSSMKKKLDETRQENESLVSENQSLKAENRMLRYNQRSLRPKEDMVEINAQQRFGTRLLARLKDEVCDQ